MSLLNRATLVKVHMLLAAFIFPVALMFLVTGAFYTWGIKGSYYPEAHTISLDKPLSDDQQYLKSVVERELQKLSVTAPSGGDKVDKAGTSFKFEWTGSERDVVLEPTSDSLSAKLTIKETSWYRHFVQLHKAKGGQLFKVYAAVLAASLFMILLSGFIMAWQVPKYRKLALTFSAAGIGMFILMIATD